MSYTSPVSAPLRQVHPFFWQKTFTDGPTGARWSKLLSWGATGVLKSTDTISGVYTASTRSISGFSTADTIYSRISGFDTAHNPVLAVLLLLILPVLAVFRPSVLMILPVLAVFRPPVLLILPVLAVRKVLDTTEYTQKKYEVYWEHL